jgi:FkbM family methyltransferase
VADKTVAFRPFPGQVFSITGNESDAGIVGELERSGGFYQRDLAALLQGRLAADAVVVDAGAHIGVVTVLLAGLAPLGHVHAFEPVPENHAHLTANVAANALDNVTVHRAAVFDTDGEISVEYDATYPGGSHVGQGGATVPSVRFDTWAAAAELDRLDLVKLDVEGVELAVLDGATETLRRFRPILVVECNPVALPRFGGTSYAALLRRLRSLCPLVGVIGAGGSITPVASPAHLRLILGQRGVVDLVALPAPTPKEVAREWARAFVTVARMRKGTIPSQPPADTFVVDAGGIRLRPGISAVSGAPGEILEVPVELTNGPHWWLSSSFAHPVNASYRWLDESGARTDLEGRRTNLPAPLSPGDSVCVAVAVELPAAPGRYTLALTLVQEHFAWLDDLDPGCTARLAATVAAPAEPSA